MSEAKELLNRIVREWNQHYGRVKVGRKYIHLVTGGWSENEEIISEAEQDFWFGVMLKEWRSGGYYKLEIPKE